MTKIGWWYNSSANCCLSVIPQRSRCCRLFFFAFFFLSLSFFLSFSTQIAINTRRERETEGEYYPLHRNICASVCLAAHSNNIYLYPIIHLFSLLRLSELYVYVDNERQRERTSFLLCRCISYQQNSTSTWLFHVRDLGKFYDRAKKSNEHDDSLTKGLSFLNPRS